MICYQLNESPIHILDAIEAELKDNLYVEDSAILLACIKQIVSRLRTWDDQSINRIANGHASETINLCRKQAKSQSKIIGNQFIDDFKSKNKVKITNEITLIKRWLMTEYKSAKVQVHNDVWKQP